MDRMVAAAIGINHHNWSIDLGSDTELATLTLAGISNHVIASDPTEALPLADGSIDLVSSRVSAHHFKGFKTALQEINRVLKNGGSLVMADTIAPEQDDIASWMNEIELRRDCSHVENRKISTIRKILTEIGFSVIDHDCTRIYLRFNEWTADTNMSSEEVKPLRRDFLTAPNTTRETFQVAPVHGDITFSWPCWVFRAIKQ